MTGVTPLQKAEADDIAALRRLADRLSGNIRSAFLDAVSNLAGKVDTALITRLIAEGRIADALQVVQEASVRLGMAPVAASITDSVVAAGRAGAAAISAARGLSGVVATFRLTNPRTMDFLNRYEMDLIRRLSGEALANVRRVITDGVGAGRNPRDVARDVRAHIGLTPYQSKIVQNYRRQLENMDAQALQRELRDRRFDSATQRAIDAGQPLPKAKIDQLVEAYERRWLKHRAETIARTESIRALNIGNTEAWVQAVENGQFPEGAIVRKWVYTHDNRTRSAHRDIPGMNKDGVGLREKFKSPLGDIMYPGDPDAVPENTINCRCTTVIRYVPSRDPAKQRG